MGSLFLFKKTPFISTFGILLLAFSLSISAQKVVEYEKKCLAGDCKNGYGILEIDYQTYEIGQFNKGVLNGMGTRIRLPREDSPFYKGVNEQALFTCEDDFVFLFQALPDILTWVELGSGHGLGPLLFAQKYPHKKAFGVEFEKARLLVGEKKKIQLGLSNVEFLHADLLTCPIPFGDVYFLYFSTGPVLDRILFELGKLGTPFFLIAIESHGDLFDRIGKECWLRPIQQVPLVSSRHHPQAMIYEKFRDPVPSLHDLSFLKKYLVIQDGHDHSRGIALRDRYRQSVERAVAAARLRSKGSHQACQPDARLQQHRVAHEGLESRYRDPGQLFQ